MTLNIPFLLQPIRSQDGQDFHITVLEERKCTQIICLTKKKEGTS